MDLTSYSQPTYQRPEVIAVAKDLTLIDDLLAGTRRMQEMSAVRKYLPKWTHEQDEVYAIRRACEAVYGGLGRTLSASTGMLFARPPKIEYNSFEEVMTEHLQNIDGLGTAFDVFAKRYSNLCIRDGFSVLLIDHTPPPPEDEVARLGSAVDKKYNQRPLWAYYSRGQVRAWRTANVNGQTVITQLVLAESPEEPVGLFGTQVVEQYRILEVTNGVAGWRILRKSSGGRATLLQGEFFNAGSGVFRNVRGETRDTLPIAVGYTGDNVAPMQCSIPLLDVAFANLGHWQIATDLAFYRRLSAFPQPYVVGELAQEQRADGQLVTGQLRFGPMVAVHLQENGEFGWRELTGSSMEQLEKGIEAKERQMSQLGMSFLAKSSRSQETAEAKRLDATAENATLATAGRGVNDALNMGLEIHAWYLGNEDKQAAPTCELNTDFDAIAMDSATMAVYVQAVASAGLPPMVLLEAWQAGGRLPPDADLEALEREMLAAKVAQDASVPQPGEGPLPSSQSNTRVDVEYDETGKPKALTRTAQ